MKKAITLVIFSAVACFAQRCDSIAAIGSGGWKPVSTAPRDGTVVEMAQTYGAAPWYGLFKWTAEVRVTNPQTGKSEKVTDRKPDWRSVDDPANGVMEECLFWRPFKGDPKQYRDPTGGKQGSVAYWCAAVHRPYDAKTDRCK